MLLPLGLGLSLFCTRVQNQTGDKMVSDAIEVARIQMKSMINQVGDPGCYPRTLNSAGELKCTPMNDWTEGFFPGALWYLYEQDGSDFWKELATKWTEKLEPLQSLTHHHDIGFIMYNSFGNAYRLTGNPAYRNILIKSAESAVKRFDPVVGSIKSWNQRKSWDGETMWYYPVIIDNMMNLELLFFATKMTGDSTFYNIAVTHAENTALNHIRQDYSTFHVVNYCGETGKVLNKQTSQGFSDNSTWARGHAWGIYGYVMAYRETGRKDFLQHALGLADYFINHPNLPEDGIPYWDFNAGQQGYVPHWDYTAERFPVVPRDASAAAIAASAMFELSGIVDNGQKYFDYASRAIFSLSSGYLSTPGTNGNFILKHSVGSIPHNQEIDVPIIYADYYFLEAISRYRRMKKL
jgi:unsaturated chondroitin disaccharide hydrolase